MKVEIYKRNQGKYTRTVTFVAVLAIGLIGAKALSDALDGYTLTRTPAVRFGIPTALILGLGLLMFWLVNRPKSADFLIATEGEMKKVSWSSRREVVGSTKVVIVTAFLMAAVLYVVDWLFANLFAKLGVMSV
jgi:preprotein translocase subunit SecE